MSKNRRKDLWTYLVFRTGKSMFAIKANSVHQILGMESLRERTTLQPSQHYLNLKEGPIPVYDAAKKFGLPTGGLTNKSCILKIQPDNPDGTPFGLIVSKVEFLIDLPPAHRKSGDKMDGVEQVSDSFNGQRIVQNKHIKILDMIDFIKPEIIKINHLRRTIKVNHEI